MFCFTSKLIYPFGNENISNSEDSCQKGWSIDLSKILLSDIKIKCDQATAFVVTDKCMFSLCAGSSLYFKQKLALLEIRHNFTKAPALRSGHIRQHWQYRPPRTNFGEANCRVSMLFCVFSGRIQISKQCKMAAHGEWYLCRISQ